MQYQELYGWRARRAGGRITIYHSHGKVPNVDEIKTHDGHVVATDKDGRLYRLA